MSLTIEHSFVSRVVNATTSTFRIFRQCACVLCLCVCAVSVFAQEKETSVEIGKRAIVPLVCLVRDMPTGQRVIKLRTIGTGFIATENGMFNTATHVIADFLSAPWNEACKAVIYFPIGGWKRTATEVRWISFSAPACQVNTAFDVAICRTDEDISKQRDIAYTAATISADRPHEGTAVFFSGFPLQTIDPITSAGFVAGYAPPPGYDTVIIDKTAWPGASGSPVYLADGKTVVGMITKTGAGEGAGLAYAVIGERIATVLADAKKNWEEEAKKKIEAPKP